MKNKIMLLFGLTAPSVMFAEGSSPTMDTTAAAGIIDAASTGLTGLLTTVTPYVTTIVLAGLAIWGAMVIIRLVKKAFSRAG